VAAAEIHRPALHELPPHGQVFGGRLIPFAMVEPHAVAVHLDRVAAGNHIDQHPPARQAIQGCGHPRRHRRFGQAGAHRDQEAQSLCQRHHGGCDDPGILAGPSGGQQDAEIAEIVRRPGDLAEVPQRDVPCSDVRAKVAAVAVGGQEPQDIGGIRG